MIDEKVVPWATPEDIMDFGKRVSDTYRLTTHDDLKSAIRLLATYQRHMAGVPVPPELAKVLYIDPTTRMDKVQGTCEKCGLPCFGRYCMRHRHGI